MAIPNTDGTVPSNPHTYPGTDVRVCVRGRALHTSNGTARRLCPFSPQPPGPWSTLLDHNYHTMRLELGADCHRLHSALPSRTTLRLYPPIRFLIVHESRVVLLLLSDQQGRRLWVVGSGLGPWAVGGGFSISALTPTLSSSLVVSKILAISSGVAPGAISSKIYFI